MSFEKGQLHIFGILFDTQELYLLPFMLIILFTGIFFITSVLGRIWCGWGCPHTMFRVIFRDLIETKILKIRKSISNKQRDIDFSTSLNSFKKIIAILIWFILSLVITSNFIWYFVPPNDFFSYLEDYSNHKILMIFIFGISAFLTIEIIFIKENFCIYMCPYARVQSVLYDSNTKTVIYDVNRGSRIYDENNNKLSKNEIKGECINCNACVKVCPTHIDIRKGLQLECINCLECVDACTNVMNRFGKKTLVSWDSLNYINNKSRNYINGKNIGYFGLISIVLIISGILITTRSSMLLNINRTTESYKLIGTGEVENHYVMLFHNTDNKPHTYYLEVINNNNIGVKYPSKPFTLLPDQKIKKRVYLSSPNNTSGIISIQIKGYALDNEKIHKIKETIFVYPKK